MAYSANASADHEVTDLFLTPAEADLTGGYTRTVAEGTLTQLGVCVPLNPMNIPSVPVDKHYATAKQEIGVPYKGHLTQQGWVLPNEADASALMKQVTRRLPQCRYHGSTSDPVDRTKKISRTSTAQAYQPDGFGWHGHQIEQLSNVNGERASVSTILVVQRGPIILALDYINYTTETPEHALRAYNLGILRKILNRAA
ncbi:hypothetical protein Pth03_44160 [Planotetraspora thailandica]|uniref:Uncharacterized protein n=1 Tax=Planotetraspora thailandica TaxID=487172 RepID=A0A8J3V2A6_9ACTN|nr:hypothetical protein Pth03_44160 [Planotetraspora thailandica]